VSQVDVLKVEVGESVKRITSFLEPSVMQMHKMCANLMDGSVRLVMVVIKGTVLGWYSTNGCSFVLPSNLHGEGTKL
jgi:hypothetical protein